MKNTDKDTLLKDISKKVEDKIESPSRISKVNNATAKRNFIKGKPINANSPTYK